jgi:hypothetical protein
MGPTNFKYTLTMDKKAQDHVRKLDDQVVLQTKVKSRSAISHPLPSFRRSSAIKAYAFILTISASQTVDMLFTAITMLALAAAGVAQAAIPEGYRKVYITSKQDTKYVIVPKSRAKESTLVV